MPMDAAEEGPSRRRLAKKSVAFTDPVFGNPLLSSGMPSLGNTGCGFASGLRSDVGFDGVPRADGGSGGFEPQVLKKRKLENGSAAVPEGLPFASPSLPPPAAGVGFTADQLQKDKLARDIEKQKKKLAKLKKEAKREERRIRAGRGEPASGSDASDDSDASVFREAAKPKDPDPTSQAALIKYAEEHPGELTSRLLKDMHKVVMGPGCTLDPALAAAPPVARSYYLNSLSRQVDAKERRTRREMYTMTTLIDLLALGKYP